MYESINVSLKMYNFIVTRWYWPRMLNWVKLRGLEFYGRHFEEINAIKSIRRIGYQAG